MYSKDYDNDFDYNDQVLDYMANAVHRNYPYDNADPDRLTGSSPLVYLISSCELTAAVKRGRPTCPEGSKINKTIISYLPGSVLSRLRAILNAAPSACYFTDGFKQAEMRMIPKASKPPTRPESATVPSLPITTTQDIRQ